MIKKVIESLELPKNEILFLHVRLKGMLSDLTYQQATENIIELLYNIYNPKTILIPTFTYSFTKTGVYDRVNTPSEVGRFGEEVRSIYRFEQRTLNPVFNVIDTSNNFSNYAFNNLSAFGKNTMLDYLANQGYVIINVNLPHLINTHLHYLEYVKKVNYRYDKTFAGKVSDDGQNFREIEYSYYVRDLNMDTKWRRKKIEQTLLSNNAISIKNNSGINANWLYTKQMDEIINIKLDENQQFLITD